MNDVLIPVQALINKQKERIKELEARLEASKGKQWVLSIYMDTDDDAEIIYQGKSYCYYSEPLHIVESFEAPSKAINYMLQNIRVVYGRKLDSFTHEWLKNATESFSNGKKATPVHNNQTYEASLWKATS